jgi:hypothetical protein
MNRIYHTWDKWECYPAGFFEVNAPNGWSEDECHSLYFNLLRDEDEFKRICLLVISHWSNSCEHNLTNERMNRIAWMGQAALCYKYRVPARFRGGYHLLSDEQKQRADQIALDIINLWMAQNGYPYLEQEQAESKTEMDLY